MAQQLFPNQTGQYNALQFNTGVYGLGAVTSMVSTASGEAIGFNDFGLQNSVYHTLFQHEIAPSRELQFQPIPRFDGRVLNFEAWRNRTIKLSGIIVKNSLVTLEQEIDIFKKNIRGVNGNLDIEFAGGIRRYTATAGTINIPREHYHIDWCAFEVIFECESPFGSDVGYTSQSEGAFTASVFPVVQDNDGTEDGELEVIMGFISAVGVSVVEIENLTRGEKMTISETITAGDILFVNGKNKEALLNLTPVDFTGFFPGLDVGENNLKITVTSTSHSYDVTVRHKNLFL